MRLRRHHRAFGKVVAFDCAAACGDEAGLVGFYCFYAVEGKTAVLVVVLDGGKNEGRRAGVQKISAVIESFQERTSG